MTSQRAEIEWKSGVPVSRKFDDPYYSLENGLAETRYVFLDGNDIGTRATDGFAVAELGIGTGLNILALLTCLREKGIKDARYTGFEAFPMSSDDMASALAPFDTDQTDVQKLLTAWNTKSDFRTPELTAHFIFGDARLTLPDWSGAADAWFLDGFAPARNPELWEPELLAQVARHTRPGGTAATYTAAGDVRRALSDAGFDVERRPGYGRKRHMTIARLPK